VQELSLATQFFALSSQLAARSDEKILPIWILPN